MSVFGYPVVLALCGRRALVVGGGAVAARKAEGLLEAGARVTVVSPRLSPALMTLATEGRLQWKPRVYAPGDLDGFDLALVATDDGDVNGAVAAEARERRVWINCADDPARCDFILPAVVRRGPLTIAVSTGGTSPAMARLVRAELERWLPADYGRLTEVVGEARRTLRERALSPSWERWRHALEDTELLSLVAAGQTAEARDHLLQQLVIPLPPGGHFGAPADGRGRAGAISGPPLMAEGRVRGLDVTA